MNALDSVIESLGKLGEVPALAAQRAVGPLLSLAHRQWAAGQAPAGDRFEPLKAGGGTPIDGLTSQMTGSATGAAVTIEAPDEVKYHQGGYHIVHRSHHAWAVDLKRELEAKKATAKASKRKFDKADAKSLRTLKKAIDTFTEKVPARPPLPRRQDTAPAPWQAVIALAVQAELDAIFGGES